MQEWYKETVAFFDGEEGEELEHVLLRKSTRPPANGEGDKGRGEEEQAVRTGQVDKGGGRAEDQGPPASGRRNEGAYIGPGQDEAAEHRGFQSRAAPGQEGAIADSGKQ